MGESPKARTAFLSHLVLRSLGEAPVDALVLKDRQVAARAREDLAAQLNISEDPQILVLDLAGITLTPTTMQEFLLPLAQRIRGGEYGTVRLVVTTADPGVSDFVRYMAQAHQLPLYLSFSPLDLHEAMPVGGLTRTEISTLDTVFALGGHVTASVLAEAAGIGPSAATNRLVNLDREGYLLRQPRGRREGDLFVEPRSATATPMACEEWDEVTATGRALETA
ncbi:MAG: hypothetical protein OXH13_00430 [Chloroflexi bacterium]|nr:hypothetical protein [Chloroflexota bacterium]MCY3695895.1 hypothetical protein [Chloroflexota bacterium]